MKIDRRKLKRRVFGFLSFSTALFVFQACYGMPQDFNDMVSLNGKVVSARTAEPVAGIKVSVPYPDQYTVTGSDGEFFLSPDIGSEYRVSFEDTDPETDGFFASKDTVIASGGRNLYFEISLEEK